MLSNLDEEKNLGVGLCRLRGLGKLLFGTFLGEGDKRLKLEVYPSTIEEFQIICNITCVEILSGKRILILYHMPRSLEMVTSRIQVGYIIMDDLNHIYIMRGAESYIILLNRLSQEAQARFLKKKSKASETGRFIRKSSNAQVSLIFTLNVHSQDISDKRSDFT